MLQFEARPSVPTVTLTITSFPRRAERRAQRRHGPERPPQQARHREVADECEREDDQRDPEVRQVRHGVYGKALRRTSKFMAHDETNDCRVGDTVRIVETRPLSANKRWRLDAIVERAK